MIRLIILVCLTTATASEIDATKDVTTEISAVNATKEILKASETGDPSKVEIVKQIRRLNEDGSYTIGYEADDGTFKIESRDVLGNVKGTFGYIDQDGEIKRVTYSSSSDSTSVPVTRSSTTPTTPTMIVRMNKTVSSTTKRPLATVVYPTRSSFTTRGTVIQPIPRRRLIPSSTRATTNVVETTTEKQKSEETTSNILNLYKSKSDDSVKSRTQILNPMPTTVSDDLITKQTTTKLPSTVKPVYEHITEKGHEHDVSKGIRRELTGTSPNPHMISLQQSAGDDSTDVYGSHLSLGTVRPLFTTTTPRPRLVPIHSLVAARQKIHQQYQEAQSQDQETTVEASTGRVFNQDVVTSNPVPVIHIPTESEDDRLYHQQPIYRRPQAAVHFRTREYLKDNPGAAVPIGNQRPFLHYELPNKVLEPQYVRETSPAPLTKTTTEPATVAPYEVRPVTRIIPIAVDERGVPIQGYQARYVNPYRVTQPQPQMLIQPRYEPLDEMSSILAPVSTRDLKRLLQILILRQNRLQALMDQIVSPGPPYQPIQLFRQEQPQYYNRIDNARQYQDEERYDYRYDQQQYRQQEMYQNQAPNYDNSQYESQRYIPRRRIYRPYDTVSASSNRIEETPEFLPPDVRESLLLKMLMLAISPDFMPTPAPPTELTTAAPPRKQVRNVQILGEDGSTDDKRSMQRQ
ncbi:uncharacterized protein ACR2FA_002198 [Aphomia sociella]